VRRTKVPDLGLDGIKVGGVGGFKGEGIRDWKGCVLDKKKQACGTKSHTEVGMKGGEERDNKRFWESSQLRKPKGDNARRDFCTRREGVGKQTGSDKIINLKKMAQKGKQQGLTSLMRSGRGGSDLDRISNSSGEEGRQHLYCVEGGSDRRMKGKALLQQISRRCPESSKLVSPWRRGLHRLLGGGKEKVQRKCRAFGDEALRRKKDT